MDISTRIQQRMKDLGLKQIDLAKKAGVSRGAVSQWMKGLTKPSRDTIDKLATILQTTPDWLRIGKSDQQELSLKNAIPVNFKVPILDYVQAGNFTEIGFDGIQPIGWDMVTEDLKDTFALIIRGDSMEPTLKEGMIVYIRPQPTAEIGDIIVAQINGDTEATIKRYKKDAGTVYLVPDNKEYDTIKITPDDNKDCKIIGKAIAAKFKL